MIVPPVIATCSRAIFDSCGPLRISRSGDSWAILPLRRIGLAPNALTYLGMDRNDYLATLTCRYLRKTFAFTGYWLNTPPGAGRNTWTGKRVHLKRWDTDSFCSSMDVNTKNSKPRAMRAVSVPRRSRSRRTAESDGFPKRTIIFLDQEQGGRMLPEQRAYIHAWIDGVVKGGYGGGVYCSGIAYRESSKDPVVTATISATTRADGESISSSAMIIAARRLGVCFQSTRPFPPRAVLRSPRCGSTLNRRDVRR